MPPADGDIVRIPPDEAGAVYANDVEVWAGRYDIAVDLFATGPYDEDEGGVPSSPIMRVRLPPAIVTAMVLGLIEALDELDRRMPT